MFENNRKQDEVKENVKLSNYVKRDVRIINWGIPHDNIFSTVDNLLSDTNTTEDSTDSILQYTPPPPPYYDILKEAFIHMFGKISYFTNLNNCTVPLEIERKWGMDIIEEGAMKIA